MTELNEVEEAQNGILKRFLDMNISDSTALIKAVTSEEYDILVKRRPQIISNYSSMDFKYNSDRKIIGIYIGEGSESQLVLDLDSVRFDENIQDDLYRLNHLLKTELASIRLGQEEWI